MRSRITETPRTTGRSVGPLEEVAAARRGRIGIRRTERRAPHVARQDIGCRYIWQEPEALVARQRLYDNLRRVGMDPEEVVLGRIEHDMDKYFYAFNLVDLTTCCNERKKNC